MQNPYLSYKMSHFTLLSNYNVSSHLLLGSLIWYYSLFLQTLIMYRVKFPSLAFCDFVVGTFSGLAIIHTQHDFGKNTSSTSWSEKDRQHTFLGVILLVVGICNAMNIICLQNGCSDCVDKYFFRHVESKCLTECSQCCKHLHFLCSGSMGLGLIFVGVVIYFHKQANEYAFNLHLFFCFCIGLAGGMRLMMEFLNLWAKVFGCAAGMTAGIILVTSSKPVLLQLSDANIDAFLVMILCTFFVSVVCFVNVYTYLQFRRNAYYRVASDDEN